MFKTNYYYRKKCNSFYIYIETKLSKFYKKLINKKMRNHDKKIIKEDIKNEL